MDTIETTIMKTVDFNVDEMKKNQLKLLAVVVIIGALLVPVSKLAGLPFGLELGVIVLITVIGYLIGMKLQRGDSVTALLMLVLGLVMSLAAFFLTKAGIFALVFGLVFAAAVPLMPSDLDPMRKALISIGAAAVIALLALALVKPIVILASGIGGGVRFAQAVMVLVTPLIASSGLSEEVRLASLLGIGAVVAISGVVAQFRAAADD